MSDDDPFSDWVRTDGWIYGRDPGNGRVWFSKPSLTLSGGPDRVVRDQPTDDEHPPFVGFRLPPEVTTDAPSNATHLWDGDGICPACQPYAYAKVARHRADP